MIRKTTNTILFFSQPKTPNGTGIQTQKLASAESQEDSLFLAEDDISGRTKHWVQTGMRTNNGNYGKITPEAASWSGRLKFKRKLQGVTKPDLRNTSPKNLLKDCKPLELARRTYCAFWFKRTCIKTSPTDLEKWNKAGTVKKSNK